VDQTYPARRERVRWQLAREAARHRHLYWDDDVALSSGHLEPFDADAALECAVELYEEKLGYEAISRSRKRGKRPQNSARPEREQRVSRAPAQSPRRDRSCRLALVFPPGPRYSRLLADSSLKWEAQRMVELWGYPRPLSETDRAAIWCWVPEGLVWYVPLGPPCPLSWWAIHACRFPRAKRDLWSPEGAAELYARARELGATRLYSLIPEIPETAGLPVRGMRRYFRIRGWSLDALGAYRDL
jgi:hypothetical protein